jgi:predicted RNase H-like nuclease
LNVDAVAGVDGCRAGWVVAISDGVNVDVRVVDRFEDIVSLLDEGVSGLAVDIPIGLPDRGARACDVDARRHLGPRHSSVFPAPPRTLLSVLEYSAALKAKRLIDGTGLSKQAFFLLPKIAEVDGVMTAELQRAVVECHPELAFARLAGAPLSSSKRTPSGMAERRRMLEEVHGPIPDRPPRGAARHDVLDALALICTARHLASGSGRRLGDGTRDRHGLVMEIAW